MKKILYGSIVMSIIYALVLVGTVVFQKGIRSVSANGDLPFVLPMSALLPEIMILLIVLAMALFLLNFSERDNRRGEIPVIVINILWLTCGSWITAYINVMENIRYGTAGTEMLASYSILYAAMGKCRPFLVFAQLLLILYAGISLGEKKLKN